jgi:hypothetical protein
MQALPAGQRVGETRLLCSTKPSKAQGSGINATCSAAQTSAILPAARQRMPACAREGQSAMRDIVPHLHATLL